MNLFPVGVKIYPKYNNSVLNRELKVGNEVRNINKSKKILSGFNNKFTGYKDSSQYIREKASIQVSKQVEKTQPDKNNSLNYINSSLRRTRNAGSCVPKKVTNKKMCNYN